jgi:Fe-S cluster biogenesis protein NfuA
MKDGSTSSLPADEFRMLVEDEVDVLNGVLQSHAGGMELVDLSDDGVVQIRFTGMCLACPLQPLTVASTVRPALLSVPGVKRAEVFGARLSQEAEERIAAALGTA